jgi:multidrug efflux pump subunit AcrA (membrane-fusion protein)
MTIDDSDVPTGSVPHQQPRPARPSWSKRVEAVVVAASIAIAALVGLSAVTDYFLRDKTASSPAPQTVTVTASPKAPNPADGADRLFLSTLATYGILDNGTDAVRQRFMEFGHHTCFSLLPPRPQPLDSTVNNILAAENQDVAAGDQWSPKFTHDDAEHLAQAAIGAYCPNAPK